MRALRPCPRPRGTGPAAGSYDGGSSPGALVAASVDGAVYSASSSSSSAADLRLWAGGAGGADGTTPAKGDAAAYGTLWYSGGATLSGIGAGARPVHGSHGA